MAACLFAEDLDWNKLSQHVHKNLPTYAVPLFVRKLDHIEVTGTFKHTKVQPSLELRLA
jgi:fatty-acyl-CoA synthase